MELQPYTLLTLNRTPGVPSRTQGYHRPLEQEAGQSGAYSSQRGLMNVCVCAFGHSCIRTYIQILAQTFTLAPI